MIIPDEITRDIETGQHMAHFGYYDGIKYAEENGLKQTTSFMDVANKTHFIVCCGDVMVRVDKTSFPDIYRREF
tara:strand:- start:192 stop:413 length:222 start_codon:yes stop_codon:yes gene_type:complete